MLQVFIQALVVIFIAAASGIFFSRCFHLHFPNPLKTIFTGMIFLVLVARIVHFFRPLDHYFFGFVCVLSAIYLLRNLKAHAPFWVQLKGIYQQGWLLLILLFLAWFSSLASIAHDEGLYHAGFIKWINTYPEIKGLANVHTRFGFNSNWHLLAALFNGYGIWPQVSNSLNFPFLLLFVGYFIYEARGHYIYQVALVVLFYPLQLVYQLIDPSSDLVVFYFTLAFILELALQAQNKQDVDGLFWVLVIPFLLTCKLNALYTAMLLWPLVVFQFRQFRAMLFRHYLVLLLTNILLLGPWILSNFWQSGYLVYPYVDSPFPVQWKVPLAWVQEEIALINEAPLMRWYTGNPEALRQMTIGTRFYQYMVEARWAEKSILLFFFGCSLALLFHSPATRKYRSFSLFLLLLFLIQWVAIPHIRFLAGTGFGIVVLAIAQYPFFTQKWLGLKAVRNLIFIQLLVLVPMYAYLYSRVLTYAKAPEWFSWKDKLPYVYDQLYADTTGSLIYYYPAHSTFCWDRIPCSNKKNDHLRLRGDSLNTGFYIPAQVKENHGPHSK